MKPIKEKFDALDYIIQNYNDCQMVTDCQTEYTSTLEYLREYNSIIEKYYNKMFCESDGSEYSLQVWYIGCLPEDWVGGFKTFDDAMDELDWFDQEEEYTFKIRHEWADEYVEMDFDPEGNPYQLSFKGTKEEHDIISAINGVDVNFLTQ